MAPKAVSLKEETELAAMMERLEMENREKFEGDSSDEDWESVKQDSIIIALKRGLERKCAEED